MTDRHVQAAMVLTVLKLIRLVCFAIRHNGSNLVTFSKDQDLCFNFAHNVENLGLFVLANDAQLAGSYESGTADIAGSQFLSPDELEPSPRP